MPKLKLEPLDSWRSVEYLCKLYPEKTAKEIIELSEHEKKCYELYLQNKNSKKLELIDKINAGALYYKGRFGLDQRFFYKISGATLSDDAIYARVEKIVVFLGDDGDVVPKGNITIEKEIEKFTSLENYGLSIYQETTAEEWESLESYLRNVSAFWDDIKW